MARPTLTNCPKTPSRKSFWKGRKWSSACPSGNPVSSPTITLRRDAGGRWASWGRTIIGLSDGTSQTFNPGDVRLIEDLTGKGHTTTYPDGYNITLQVTPAEDL